MRTLLYPALLLALISGCHGRYKRNADALGRVRLTVQTPDAAQVDNGSGDVLSEAATEDAVGAGVEVATILLGMKAQKALSRGTDPVETRKAMSEGLLEGAQSQPLPYTLGEKGRAELVISIESWGLDPAGGQPVAYLQTFATIHDKQGKVVYRASERCERTVGQGMQIPIGDLGELNAMRQLAEMEPKQMNRVLSALTEQCASQIARELSTHLR